jgi:hypothetical protein
MAWNTYYVFANQSNSKTNNIVLTHGTDFIIGVATHLTHTAFKKKRINN